LYSLGSEDNASIEDGPLPGFVRHDGA
jgi:hypothetical protein